MQEEESLRVPLLMMTAGLLLLLLLALLVLLVLLPMAVLERRERLHSL